ncbi:MAG: asparagine synthetase B, partial [Proteobacteria bacterium]|nr:asparagine synthetase B [Pseudomonadota bacterium]
MSAIFGVFHLDGRPAAPEALGVMAGAMDHWGPDGSGSWRDGPVGLGHLMLHNTPESLSEPLPFQDPGSGLTITAAARIDNREELLEAIGLPHSERAAMPDSLIILKAYQKWGQRCPDRLIGDWAFAV